MLEPIRRAISFLRHRQILHKLGVAVSVTVIGIACYVLYHMLRNIDTFEVLEAIKSTEPRSIALAALFVAAGYFTLTFYDLFAMRAIGRNDIPYRINALAAFTSYSIGHNVGAIVFTGQAQDGNGVWLEADGTGLSPSQITAEAWVREEYQGVERTIVGRRSMV